MAPQTKAYNEDSANICENQSNRKRRKKAKQTKSETPFNNKITGV